MTISTRIYNDQAVAAVNRLTADLQKIQGQISSGKTTSRASDNPLARPTHPLCVTRSKCLNGSIQT